MAQSLFTPSTRSNSFTLSRCKTLLERSRCTTRIAQCTHITMTRVYNEDFRCALCLRPGPMGWLYRCTQDRELLIEDDLENECPNCIDQLAFILEPSLSPSPRKRSPAARASSNLAFIDEISQADLKTYSSDQISTVLKQRTKLLEVVKNSDNETGIFLTDGLGLELPTARVHDVCSPFAISTSLADSSPKKSWYPTHECQFKCCHTCRPGLAERNYLSLSAVANGELPATAVTGFGFHYQKKRPVTLVKHASNLGLRSNPQRSTEQNPLRTPTFNYGIKPSPSRQISAVALSASSANPFNDELNADTTFGQPSNAYDSTVMARCLNGEGDTTGDGGTKGQPFRREFGALALRQRIPANIATPCVAPTQGTDASILKRPISPKTGLKRSPRYAAMDGNMHETIQESEIESGNGERMTTLQTTLVIRNRLERSERNKDGNVSLTMHLEADSPELGSLVTTTT